MEEAEKAARRYGLPLPLVLATMAIESNNEADKVNTSSGATGLLQVREVAAKEVLANYPELKKEFPNLLGANGKINMNELKKPEVGLAIGSAALKINMDRFDGDAKKALAAYNMGYNNFKELGFDLARLAKGKETDNYIKNIEKIFSDRGLAMPTASLFYHLSPQDRRCYLRQGKADAAQ